MSNGRAAIAKRQCAADYKLTRYAGNSASFRPARPSCTAAGDLWVKCTALARPTLRPRCSKNAKVSAEFEPFGRQLMLSATNFDAGVPAS